MSKYVVTKIVEAELLEKAIEKESEAEIKSIALQTEKIRIGY